MSKAKKRAKNVNLMVYVPENFNPEVELKEFEDLFFKLGYSLVKTDKFRNGHEVDNVTINFLFRKEV